MILSNVQVPFEPEAVPEISGTSAEFTSFNGDLLVMGCYEEDFNADGEGVVLSSPMLKELDGICNGSLSDLAARFGFKGSKGAVQSCWAGSSFKSVALVGMGKKEKKLECKSFGKAIASVAKAQKAATVGVVLTNADGINGGDVANGIVNGAYESTRFKSKPNKDDSKVSFKGLKSVEFLFNVDAGAIATGVAYARGSLFTRYLVEAPPNVCTPSHLAAAAKHIANMCPECMSLKVLEKEDCEALGMGLYLGVAEASKEPPKFIHLKYSPPQGNASRKIAIVGKGLTFDAGGYNLKVGASMIELMKFDMGGSGAALGAARSIAEIKPADVEINFIIASCENMIDGRGLRPGDILVASNGKTVEVNNTDAEGRLTLADALLYAQNECNVDYIVDIATLTGACMVALGGDIGGMYASTDAVAEQLKKASSISGDKIWHMPLEEAYLEQMKSPIADYKNSGGRLGGSITAALFLKEFVDTDKCKWSHLDIAGPVWSEKEGGATGFGAQLLTEWSINHST